MGTARHIIVFGGSFAPPTRAHEAIIAACLALPGYDEVWVLPSGDRTDKTPAASEVDRLAMLHLVKAERFANDPRLHISDFELRLPRPTMTCQTIAALQAAHPGTRFVHVFGEDAYLDMPNWEEGVRLQRELSMLLVPRGRDSCLVPSVQGRLLFLPEGFDHVSSTEVRRRLKAGGALDDVLSPPVMRYVIGRGRLRLR